MILWLDGGAACAAGAAVLLLRDRLASLYGFSPTLVSVLAVTNLAYGSYSGTLAVLASYRQTPRRRAIEVLALANFAWTLVCAVLLMANWRSATMFGVAQLAGEGLFVGALALAEWRIVRPSAR